jgi:Fic family protein
VTRFPSNGATVGVPADGRPAARQPAELDIELGSGVSAPVEDISATNPSDTGWPALASESIPWKPRARYAAPPGQRSDYGPYWAAVVPEIADIPYVPLSPETLNLAAHASADIARFDAEFGDDVAPFAAILLRTESVASSRIENLTASAKAIALAEAGDTSRDNARVIVANTEAMKAAIALAGHLDADAILAMHDALLRGSQPQYAGKWRQEQVWIGGGDLSPHSADFVPPHHSRVEAAIADLVRFMEREDVPPLVQAATAHAQFETIHPFPDGNGRTGRALVQSLLRGKGLTRKVTVPVSAGLLTDTDAYFDALTVYRRGDPDPIVSMMTSASYAAINDGHQLVTDLRALRARWDERITARRGSGAQRAADLLLSQPVVDSPMLQRELGLSDSAALEAIRRLVADGVLFKVSGRARYRRYSANEVLACLDDFAARAGRRGGF